MKKNLVLTALFLGISVMSFAQLRFGLQGTPTFNWVTSESENIESNLRVKFNYGLLLEKAFAENYLISSGIFHSFDGGQIEFTNPEDSTLYALNLQPEYIEIPMMLKMRTKEIGYITYFAKIGLAGAIRISDDYAFADESISKDDVLDPNDNVSNLFKGSMKIGLGAEYNLGGSTSLVFGATLTNNFTNMLEERSEFGNVNDASRFKNVGINLAVIF